MLNSIHNQSLLMEISTHSTYLIIPTKVTSKMLCEGHVTAGT